MDRVYCKIREKGYGKGKGGRGESLNIHLNIMVVMWFVTLLNMHIHMRNLGGGGEKGCSPPRDWEIFPLRRGGES